MTPSSLQSVLERINELQAPPPSVARFANTLVQAAWTSATTPTAAAAAANTTTAGYASPVATARVTADPTGAVTARRAVTPGVNRPMTAASAVNPALPDGAAQWMPSIRDAATKAGIDPDLLTSVVWVESAFHPDSVSSAGAIGLAQLMPGTAKGLGVDPTDPVQNLQGSARMLRGLIDQFGRVDHALAAYNVGPNGLARGLAEGRFPGSGYARAVATKYQALTGRELFP